MASTALQRSAAPGPAVSAPPAQLPREGKESIASEQKSAGSGAANAAPSSEPQAVSGPDSAAAASAPVTDQAGTAAAATSYAAESTGQVKAGAVGAGATSAADGDPLPAARDDSPAGVAPAAQQVSGTTAMAGEGSSAAASQPDPQASAADVIMAEADGDDGRPEPAAAEFLGPPATPSPVKVDLPAQPDVGGTEASAPEDPAAPIAPAEAQAPSPARPDSAAAAGGEDDSQLAVDAQGSLDGTPGKRKVRLSVLNLLSC